MIALMWLSMYFVLRRLSKSLGDRVPISTWIVWLGEIGVLCYGMAVATIDNGKMAHKLHSVTAVIFFIFWAINMCLVTFAYYELKLINKSVISNFSLNIKFLSCGFLITLWIIEAITLVAI